MKNTRNFFATALMAFGLLGTYAQAQSLVQEFYVPLPEANIRQFFVSLSSNSAISNTFESVVSVTVGNNNTRVVYDHWEDGYEVDLNNPSQSTTEIWGDGNNANGKPPGYANDPLGLPAGTVIALRNQVTLPRNASQIRYDGRDRLGASNAIVVTRSSWATTPGPLLADSVEMLSTVDWGKAYTVPVGEDVIFPTPLSSSMFEKVGLVVQAAENGTSVQIDKDANGSAETTVTLNRGEIYYVANGVKKGATVTSSRPVQLHILTGDVNANYETRWYTIWPDAKWSSEYYSPVGTASNGEQAYGFFYNPDSSPITINYRTNVGSGTFDIPAKGTAQFLLPQDSATHFASDGDKPFFGIVTAGAKPTANQVYDWGFTLVPKSSLTTALVVGWGPGSEDGTKNGNPVWVTAIGATRIYVDYNGDRNGSLTDPTGQKYDVHYDLSALEVKRIFDPDKDQTAMRVYTVDGTLITGAWGQDPATAGAARPYLDMGTTVPAFPAPVIFKSSRIAVDNGDPGPTVGDVVEYTIRLENRSLVAISAVSLVDSLPAGLSYIANTTEVDGNPVPDAGVTPFPLDEDGLQIPIIQAHQYTELTFQATIDSTGTFVNVVEAVGFPGTKGTDTLYVPEDDGPPSDCETLFTDSSGNPVVIVPGQPIYVTITDPDITAPYLTAAVFNSTNGDTEIITLNNISPGIYRNLVGLATSSSTGAGYNDGTLYVRPGDALNVYPTDPAYSNLCSADTTVVQESEFKQLYLTQDAADNDLTGNLDRIDPVAAGDNSTSSSALLEKATGLTIQSSSSVSGSAGDGTVSTSHTTAAGNNRLMIVGVSYRNVTGSAINVTNVTYNGTALTYLGQRTQGSTNGVEIWYMVNPPVGSANVQVTATGLSGNDSLAFGVTTFSGVDQSTPLGTFASAGASSSSASVSVSSATDDIVFAVLAAERGSTTANPGQTSQWNRRTLSNNNGVRAAGSTESGSNGSVNMTWSLSSSRNWAAAGVSIKPASNGAATYTQTPNFVAPFIMPTGGLVSGRAWVDVPSGYLPTNVAVPATLSYGGTNFITMSNAVTTLVSGGYGPITNGTTSVATNGSTRSLTLSHNVAAGNDRLLMVSLTVGASTSTGSPGTGATVSFRGTAMNLVATRHSGTEGSGYAGNDTISYIYSTVAPATGSGNVVVTNISANSAVALAATTFYNVDQATPLGTPVTAGGEGTNNPTVTVASGPNEVVYGTSSADEGATLTPNGNVTDLWNSKFHTYTTAAVGKAAGAASVNFGYSRTGTTEDWAIAAVSIKPGLYPAVYRLDWSGVLSAEHTIPTGQAVSLTVENNNANTPFKVLYDSATYPSRIDLPTTTVIKTTALGVYAAPYPDATTLNPVIAGQTGYVRVAVTDPFGTADITSVDLNIDGPGVAGDISTTLGAGQVVADDGVTKIYEYPWVSVANFGTYSITATAHEGTEGTVTSSQSIEVPVTQYDTGSPSTTDFNKEIYAPDETVCITTKDLDQNKDPNVAETVTVTVTTSGGDTESVVLTETGVDTGIFYACITANSTTPGADEDGTLYAPPGSLLDVQYVDPDDPTDTSGDTAVVSTPGASVKVTKELLTPADGQAIVGEGVSYRLRVSNTGPGALATVTVDDTFPAANLSFVDASIAPDSTGSGTLHWNNVGPLTPGQTREIIVNFTALASANPATNSVTVNATGGLSSTDSEDVIITNPRLNVTKTLTTPPSGPIAVGDEATFTIQVENTGDTTITELPLEDTYSGATFAFVSATPAPDGQGYGSIFWADLTGGGSLAPGQSTSVTVTLRAVGQADPGVNNAVVAYAIDEHGDPVPPDEDDASITTQAASISGSVFNDLGNTGNFDGSNGPLGSVTVRLYTDPDGDGDPSDGVLVDMTTTAPDGSYSFLNLPLGKYVVVQEDLVGFESINDTQGAPTDNRVAVNVTTLTDYPGNDFLDREIDPSQYGSISGQVRLDEDADGNLSDPDPGISGVTVELYTDPNGDGDPSDGVLIRTTTTNAGGNYTFPLVPPGKYVVVETDPPGHVSTADTHNPNDNRVPVTLPNAGTSTGNDFLDALEGGSLATIGDTVWLDVNNNGIMDVGESGIDGVVIWLYRAGQTPGVDAPYRVTTTGNGGLYELANLPVGDYTIMIPPVNFQPGHALASSPLASTVSNSNDDQINNDNNGLQPGGSGTAVLSPQFNLGSAEVDNTKDFGFVPTSSLGVISGSVLIDTDLDGMGDDPAPNVTLTLVDVSGNPVLDSNGDPITTTSALDGSYSFGDVPPGTYGVKRGTPPTGYTGFADADGGDDVAWIGDETPITLPPGGTSTDNDFLLRTQKCPPTWAEWQTKWDGLGLDDTTPEGNEDGDGLPNLLEYAFCLSPLSGGGTPYCMTPNVEAVDKADLTFRRTAGGPTDVTYEIEYAATLGENSTTWTTVAIPPANMVVTPQTDGTDRVRVTDLESITGLTAGTGFVRLKVSLDADHNGTPEATASSDVGGWIETPLDLAIRSFNDPFLECPIFTGTISAIDGQDIVSAVSGGGIDYNARVTAEPSYAEILTGPYQGHRFDIVGGGVNRFTTAVDNNVYSGTPPFSTLSAPPSGLVGEKFVVRPHRTIGDVFPTRAFIPTDDPETASMVQMYSGESWNTYWLYNDGGGQGAVPGWITVGDQSLVDQSGSVLPPGQGGFIYTRQEDTPGAKFIISGKVRPNDFIRPLVAGWNNMGGGYPLVQSAFGRNMKKDTSNFYGDRNWAKADQFRIWRGDYYDGISETSYDSYFMVGGTVSRPVDPDWFKTGDATYTKQNDAMLFRPDYSIIISRKYAIPDYHMAVPWKP